MAGGSGDGGRQPGSPAHAHALRLPALTSTADVLAAIDAVTVEDVREIAGGLLEVTPTLAVIGPFDADRDFSTAVA